MAKLAQSLFTFWEFEADEIERSFILSDLNYKRVQNEICAIATERSSIRMSVESQLENFGTLEYLRGKIEALQFLLYSSDKLEHEMREAASMEAALHKQREARHSFSQQSPFVQEGGAKDPDSFGPTGSIFDSPISPSNSDKE